MPTICNNLLPLQYRNLTTSIDSPIIDMFPKKVFLDMLGKDLYWQCIPLIPNIDVNRILMSVNKIKLNNEEMKRNKELKDFVIN